MPHDSDEMLRRPGAAPLVSRERSHANSPAYGKPSVVICKITEANSLIGEIYHTFPTPVATAQAFIAPG
jgi:hypothetical protein